MRFEHLNLLFCAGTFAASAVYYLTGDVPRATFWLVMTALGFLLDGKRAPVSDASYFNCTFIHGKLDEKPEEHDEK